MRYTIRRSLLLRPLFLIFGGTQHGSFLEIGGDVLRVRFGPLFDETFPLALIEGAELTKWPWLFGLGWRTDMHGRIALVGSYGGTVEIRLREKQRMRFLLPFWRPNCDRVVVSLEAPEDFLAALRRSLARV